jgi:hypothetical protein
LHFEKRNDVLVESRIVTELFDEVEKNVRSKGLQFLTHKIDIVIDGEMIRRMAERTQRSHNVSLGLPVLRFHLFGEVLVERGRTCAVEKYEDFEFLFHAIWCA